MLKGLQGDGVPNVGSVRSPAGIDLGARTAPEVALSIVAEIVQLAPAQAAKSTTADHHTPPPPEPQTAIDPVCHMHVQVASARHIADAAGTTYYFCCAECRGRFVEDPEQFLASHQ